MDGYFEVFVFFYKFNGSAGARCSSLGRGNRHDGSCLEVILLLEDGDVGGEIGGNDESILCFMVGLLALRSLLLFSLFPCSTIAFIIAPTHASLNEESFNAKLRLTFILLFVVSDIIVDTISKQNDFTNVLLLLCSLFSSKRFIGTMTDEANKILPDGDGDVGCQYISNMGRSTSYPFTVAS